jgi:ribosomal protein S18 acetylase RimI-like enzyme
MEIDYLDHLPDEFKASAVRLFLTALKDKLVPILGNDGRAQEVLEKNLDTTCCIAAIFDQKLVGILAIQNSKSSFLNPTLKTLIKAYGILGGVFRICGLALLHHSTAPHEFYVDGVAVVDEMRCKGVGSRLFDVLERIALEKGIERITLAVTDTNPRAEALYKRFGFVRTEQITFWPLNWIFTFPFKSVTMMAKTMNQQGTANNA